MRLPEKSVVGPFFVASDQAPTGLKPPLRWQDRAVLFGWAEFDLGALPPPWHTNLLNREDVMEPDRHWSQIGDFDQALGDIKTVWELSRFDWVIANSQRAREGDAVSLQRLNDWLTDWVERNPAYRGPNWKCGQESSIRVLHLAAAAHIMGQALHTQAGLLDLIRLHMRRIAPTIGYAIGQNNNHGTSEAAALFIGGNWLLANGDKDGQKWANTGRRVLENRVGALIADDGSFSQYSLVYHRVLIDTLSMVEIWRRKLSLSAFSHRYQDRARSATLWIQSFVDPDTGHVPNIGANDGAQLIPLGDWSTLDFRPSLSLAMALHFQSKSGSSLDGSNLPAEWFEIIPTVERRFPQESALFPDGGFAVLRAGQAAAFMRFPRFRFRPSQADALHVDLWVEGKGLLRDGGSYSYANAGGLGNYFNGTAGHNSIMFDDQDQMPKIGRFLFAEWLSTSRFSKIEPSGETMTFSAGYRTRNGMSHDRAVSLSSSAMMVTDTVSGFRHKAVLRWRLPVGDWMIIGQVLTHKNLTLELKTSIPIVALRLVEGFESLRYCQKSICPILEVEIADPGTLITKINW
jgi:hypothetical protein